MLNAMHLKRLEDTSHYSPEGRLLPLRFQRLLEFLAPSTSPLSQAWKPGTTRVALLIDKHGTLKECLVWGKTNTAMYMRPLVRWQADICYEKPLARCVQGTSDLKEGWV